MLTPAAMTLLIFAVAAILLLSERLRADLVALLVVVALGVTGVLTPRDAFSGFGSSAVITIAAIFILAEALRVTGVTDQAALLLLRASGRGEGRLVAVVMLAGAALSLVMNNIAAAAVLLPAISGAASRGRVNPSRLLMPLAFATILGGMATLFTTTNIVVSGLLRGEELTGFGVLDFAAVGLPIVAVGVGYMALWGRRRLPQNAAMSDISDKAPAAADLAEIYRLGERLFRARIPAGSCLEGKPLAHSGLRERYGVNVVAIERGGRVIPDPKADVVLGAGDIVLLSGKLDEVTGRDADACLELLPGSGWRQTDLATQDVVIVEAILAPRSTLLGQTLRTTRFREKYGMTVLGVWRAGRPIRTRLGDLPLAFGDALLLQGPRRRLSLLQTEPDLILLSRRGADETARPALSRGRLALAIMGGALLLAAFDTSLIGEIMLGAALLTVLAGILTLDQAYTAIEWRSIFLVAGMLPLGLAMGQSGAAALLGNHLVSLLHPLGPMALLAGLFILATLLTQMMHGAAVAAIVAPIAIQVARQAGLDPRSLAMAVALGTSMAFLTPLGHPVNVLVMGPGGYRFRDYFRVGLPLTLLLFVVIMVFLPVVWPLTPR